MSGKKERAWKRLAAGFALSAAAALGGAVLVSALTLQGTLREPQMFPALLACAFAASLLGSLHAGKGTLGSGGSLASAGILCGVLLGTGLCLWGGITAKGAAMLADILAAGTMAGLLRRKVGKRRGKRLVKSTKQMRTA